MFKVILHSILILSCPVFFLFSCQQTEKKVPATKKAAEDYQYFGLDSPGEKPQLFSPNFISTHRNERDYTQNPSGNTVLYSLVLPANNLSVIMYQFFDGLFWSEPEVARFSGQYKDLEPAFTPDGSKLFFVSKRPVDKTYDEKDYDIWYIDVSKNGWSNPINLGSPVNTASDEYFPTVSKNGNLYFTASYEDSFGEEDIYLSKFENGSYTTPVNLGDSINTDLYEFNSFIAPDESYLIFSSLGREDDAGGGDLYISYKNTDGSWTKARNMGKQINSGKLDYCPFVSHDEKYFFFTSQRETYKITNRKRKQFSDVVQLSNSIKNGLGNIYWMEFDKDAWR